MNASYGPMPELLVELADLVGLETTLKIASNYGGVRVDIPRRARKDHWLTKLVGIRDAQKICLYFRTISPDGSFRGAHHVIIPKGPASNPAKLREQFAWHRFQGLSVREASRRCGLSERTGWRLNSKMRRTHNSRQSTLFD